MDRPAVVCAYAAHLEGEMLNLARMQSAEIVALKFANADLLEALRAMVRAIHEPDTMSGVLLTKAEAAIAKATIPPRVQR